jgi:hypothetical protein
VRHHLLIIVGAVVAWAEFAEIVNTPRTFESLRVLHAIPGDVLVPEATAGEAILVNVRVALVAVLFVESLMVRTNVWSPNDHEVESNVNIPLVRFVELLVQHPVELSKVP